MTPDNTAAPNRGIDDILEQTEMGSFIAKNKAMIITLVVLIFAGIAGFGVWNWMSSNKNAAAETAIFEYSKGSLDSFSNKAIDGAGLVKGFENLKGTIGSYKGLFPVGIETAGLLVDAGNNAEAIQVLEGLNSVVNNPYQRFVLATNLSVAYENAGDNAKALASLEQLVKSNVGFMEAKVYLDLGRLALALGDQDKARSNLQWVIDKGEDAEMTLLARLYMSKLEQK
tara:strand:- start:5201 stop:5881 length:681 start_codon:yes stop_codon:yes gene_type:complete